jgi:hypothetical protein
VWDLLCLQTHARYSDDGDVTTGPMPSHTKPALRSVLDHERRPMESFGLVPVPYTRDDIVNGIGLVVSVEDFARLALRAALDTHPGATYPGFQFKALELLNTYSIKSWSRRPFQLDTRPLKDCITDSPASMVAPHGTAGFTKSPERTRSTIWVAATNGFPVRSAEIVCAPRITVVNPAHPDDLFYYDSLFVQWHVPVVGPGRAAITRQKPSRVVPGFSERPRGLVPQQETAAQAVTAEYAYVTRHGSKALAGGSIRTPCDAYHPHVPCDVVALGPTFELIPVCSVIRRADIVPCFDPARYGHVPGLQHNSTRPPLLRMFPRM